MISKRLSKLRSKILNAPLKISTKRALLITESYKETEGEPVELRRAKAFKKILDNIPIWIDSDELIVSHANEGFRSASIFPEMHIEWLEDEIDNLNKRKQEPFIINEKQKTEIKKIIPYWKGKTLYDYTFKAYPEEIKIAREKTGIFSSEQNERGGVGNVLLDYPSLLKKGLNLIREETCLKLNRLDCTIPENYESILFYKAAIIVCDVTIKFANRYSNLARKLAQEENDLKRKKELLKISEICKKVPAEPANTLYEALQSIWFVQLLVQIETNGTSISLGRIDQYLLPYYIEDTEKMILTKLEVIDLIGCFFIKLNEIVRLYDKDAALINVGLPTFQNIALGGRTEDNTDATNELTYICLNLLKEVRLPQIQTVLKVHKQTPDNLLEEAFETVKVVQGMPSFLSDEVEEKFLLTKGISLKESRTAAYTGCVTPAVYGMWSRGGAAYFNLLKVLELTLNEGRDMLTGIQVGPQTESSQNFNSMDDLIKVFKIQLNYCIKEVVTACNSLDIVMSRVMPHKFNSIFVKGCLQSGKDTTRGGALYNFTRVMLVGTANIADSLAVLQSLVFDKKIIKINDFIKVLKDNFKGQSGEILEKYIGSVPKFGNDVNYVDKFAVQITNLFFNEIEKYHNPRGGTFIPAFQSLLSNIYFGLRTSATPDGRKAKESLADTLSPVHGKDKKGPTAVMKSVSKIELARAAQMILNLRLQPSLIQSKESIIKLCELIKTFLVDLEGGQVQFNVISGDILRKAQKNPDEYRDLIVRVTGYSAFFVELNREAQNDILARTEHFKV